MDLNIFRHINEKKNNLTGKNTVTTSVIPTTSDAEKKSVKEIKNNNKNTPV